VVVTKRGVHYLVETKGLEDINVANKDRAAQVWCQNASRLTGQAWAYVKVRQPDFEQLQPGRFQELLSVAPK
jgi:type III restriction enzyme